MRICHALPLVLALALPACAGETAAMRKELGSLREELGRVRAQNNLLTARIETLEIQTRRLAQAPTATTTPAPAAASTSSVDADRPSLDVVRLAPAEPTSEAPKRASPDMKVDVADDGAPRPVLRSTGRGDVTAFGVSPSQTRKPNAPRPAQVIKGTAP